MVVLVPFLLITAVFSRVTIMELDLPSSSNASVDSKQQLSIEVIVREKGLEIGNGKQILARLPLLNEEDIIKDSDKGESTDEGIDISKLYDIETLAKYLTKIKTQYPNKTDAMVLMESDIEYRVLIRIMDAVRATFVRQAGAEGEADILQQVVLFPDISIGDAP